MKTATAAGLLVSVFLLLFGNLAQAQTFPLQIQVSVLPPYSAYLQDYPGTGQRVRVFLINTSRQSYQIRLSGQLTGDNGVEIRTSPNYRPPRPLTVPPGQTLLSRTDLEGLFDLNQIEVTGIDKNLLSRGFPLPDGTYQLCVRAFNETATNTAAVAFGQPLSAEFPLGCSAPIVVRAVEPPILISPLCDAEVTATTPQATVFTWTPPIGVSPAQVDYTLRVVELPQINVDPNVFIDAVALPRSGVEVRNLRTSTFLYGPTQPPLTVGKRYAWRVQAVDRSGKLNFLNDGKSPVCSFTYGTGLPVLVTKPGFEVAQTPVLPILPITSTDTTKKVYAFKEGKLPVNCSCKTDVADKSVSNTSVLASRMATIAGFQLSLLDNVKESDGGVLNGDGMIPLPLINSQYARLRVHLYDVQCNAAGQVISGVVRARYSDKADPSLKPNWDNPDYTPPALTSDQIGNISQTLTNNKDMLVSSLKNSANSLGFDVPFGIDKSFGPITTNIAITDVTFTPEQAYYQANTWIVLNSKPGGFNGIPLSGYNLCMSPDKPFCGEGLLYLGQEMELSKFLSLKGGPVFSMMKAEDLMAKYTYVAFGVDGFQKFGIRAGLKPPKMLRANDNSPAELLAGAEVLTPDFDNWVADVTFDDFYIDGLKDFVFSSGGQIAKYDHAQDSNPGDLPADYEPGKTPDWTGLFIPKLSLTMPFLKSLNNGKNVPVGVQNMIYDTNGFTGDAFAGDETSPLIALGDGNLSSWYCSADQLKLSFRQSEFQSSSLLGRVVLPICKVEDKSAVIPYTCTLSKNPQGGNMDFQFLLQPKDKIHAEVWVADLGLDPTSHIGINYVNGTFGAEALLSGKISIHAGPLDADLIKFEDLGFKTDGGFSLKSLSTASPDKTLGGLPLSFTGGSLTAAKNEQNAPVASSVPGTKVYDFGFTGALALSETVSLTASTTVRLRFYAGISNGRPAWGHEGDFVFVDDIHVNGNFNALSVDGDLQFYHNTAKMGNGFGGKVTMGLAFLGPGTGFSVQAHFGTKLRADNTTRFSYWQVGGLAILPVGIPIPATPLMVNGFGGGVASNMKVAGNVPTGTGSKPPTALPTEMSYEPEENTTGFNASVVVSTADGTMLRMIGTLGAGFVTTNNQVKIDSMYLNVNAYVLATDIKGSGALATGYGSIGYSFTHNVFDGAFGLQTDYTAGGFGLKASGDVVFHFGSTWYFSIGEPESKRIELSLLVGGTELFKAGAYFMTGNDLHGISLPPAPYGMDAATLAALNYRPMNGNPTGTFASIDSNNPFLAFGAGYKSGGRTDIGPFYFSYDFAAGYDALLRKTDGCPGMGEGGTTGVNNWYANGQLYGALGFKFGVHVDVWFYEGDFDIVSANAGFLLQGGMPNPVWLHGSAFFKFRVLRGLVKGSVNMDIWYNEAKKCEPVATYSPPSPFAKQPLIARLGPSTGKNETVSVMTPFYAEFNYPVQTQIEVENTRPDKSILKRLFRLDFMPGQRFGLLKTAGATPPNFAQCEGDVGGQLSFRSDDDGESNRQVYFYRNATLTPQSNYSLTLGIEAFVYNDTTGSWTRYNYKGTPVNQTASVKFTTGDCVTKFIKADNADATVLYSYPFEGQRHFMQTTEISGIPARAMIMLRKKMCCMDELVNDVNYNLAVHLIPYQYGMDFMEKQMLKATNVEFVNNKYIKYQMPQLKSSTLYWLQLVREPTDAYVQKIIAQEDEARKKAAILSADNMVIPVGIGNQFGGKATTGAGQYTNAGLTGPQFMPAGLEAGKESGSGPTASVNATILATGKGAGQFYASVDNKAVSLVTNQYDKVVDTYYGKDVAGAGYVTMSGAGKALNQNVAVNVKAADAAAKLIEYKKLYTQRLYDYYFQTSKYETMTEKLAACTLKQNAPLPNIGNYEVSLNVSLDMPEGFDVFEMGSEELNDNITRPALIQLRADTKNLANPWMQQSLIPLVDRLNQYGPATIKTSKNLYHKPYDTDAFARRLMRMIGQPQPAIDPASIGWALLLQGLLK